MQYQYCETEKNLSSLLSHIALNIKKGGAAGQGEGGNSGKD